MLSMGVSITLLEESQKGRSVGHPLGQTLGHASPRSGNPRLRLERLVRRWEQDDVAAGLEELASLLEEPAPRVDANLVSKWERGVRHPGTYYTPRLCLLFQMPPEHLGFLPGPRLAAECRNLSDALGRALARRVGDVRRREFLQHLLWGGAALASGSIVDAERIVTAASDRVDGRLLDDLGTVAAVYAERMHTAAPRELLPQVERHLGYLHSLLRTEQPAAQQGRLHLVAGTMSAVAGRLAFTLGNRGDAHARYVSAEGHAQEAGDGPLRAYVLGQRSHLYSDLWRDGHGPAPSMALHLLDAAHAAAGDSASPWLRTWLSVRRAEEHAAGGDAHAAYRDLEHADQVLATGSAPDVGFFAHWHAAPSARLAGYRGNCTQLLGDAREGTPIIEDALRGVDATLVSVRSTLLADLAMAYAKEQEVEHACSLLTHSLELASDVGLVAHVQRVIGVRRHLSRWDDVAAVAQLDERLHRLTWVPL
jgi:transcriptional regulator with XRE-family HTH domain